MFETFLGTVIAFLLTPGGFFADASASDLLQGYAWSPHSGWVSANCTNTGCGSSTYGITVSGSAPTKSLSGYMWSSSLGWISFNSSDLIGCPSGTCSATMNTTSGRLSGWGRVIAAYGVEAGGWDGWVKLNGENYNVLANGNKWTGYAWGGGQVIGTGEFSPAVGGNAVLGWLSFRGVTPHDSTSRYYGVQTTATTSLAAGPRTIFCDVSVQMAGRNEDVTWRAVVDTAVHTGTITYDWSLPTSVRSPVATDAANTMTVRYPTGGVKTGAVTVTVGTIPYVVDCDAQPLSTGVIQPLFSYVLVGYLNLTSLTAPDAPTVSAPYPAIKAEVSVANFGGSNTGVTCKAGDPTPQKNCEYQLETPFNNVIQIHMLEGGAPPADNTGTGYFVPATPAISLIDIGETKLVTGTWPVPHATCPYDGIYETVNICKAWARVCADYLPNPSDTDTPPRGVICEYGDTGVSPNCSSTFENCSPWTSFNIEEAPPPPPTVGACRGTPAVSKVGQTITWSLTENSVIDGEPPFTYVWSSLTPGSDNDLTTPDPSQTSITKVYTTPGTKRARVTITDVHGRVLVRDCAGVVRLQIFEEI